MHQLDRNPHIRDEYLADAIRPGGLSGEKAIISLYTTYHKSVKAVVSELISIYPGCRAEPDDIVHDAFLLMVHKIQFESAHAKSLKSFWIGIARKIILNHVKKQKRITLVEDFEEDYGAPEISPEAIFLITEKNQRIENYLTQFGNRCKQILILWVAQYTMDEIAEQLHLSGASMARKIKYGCFKKLKKVINKGHMFDL